MAKTTKKASAKKASAKKAAVKKPVKPIVEILDNEESEESGLTQNDLLNALPQIKTVQDAKEYAERIAQDIEEKYPEEKNHFLDTCKEAIKEIQQESDFRKITLHVHKLQTFYLPIVEPKN